MSSIGTSSKYRALKAGMATPIPAKGRPSTSTSCRAARPEATAPVRDSGSAFGPMPTDPENHSPPTRASTTDWALPPTAERASLSCGSPARRVFRTSRALR
jgi:hypothetical protein